MQRDRKHHRSNAELSPVDAVGSHGKPSYGVFFAYAQNNRCRSAVLKERNGSDKRVGGSHSFRTLFKRLKVYVIQVYYMNAFTFLTTPMELCGYA